MKYVYKNTIWYTHAYEKCNISRRIVQNEICTNLNISILIQNISHLAMLLYSMEGTFVSNTVVPNSYKISKMNVWVVKRYKSRNRATTEPKVKSTWINSRRDLYRATFAVTKHESLLSLLMTGKGYRQGVLRNYSEPVPNKTQRFNIELINIERKLVQT